MATDGRPLPENIGIRKMGLISRHIAVNALETVATHYFSPEMVLRANDVIVAYSNALPLADLFRREEGVIHTGSDGQNGAARAVRRIGADVASFGLL